METERRHQWTLTTADDDVDVVDVVAFSVVVVNMIAALMGNYVVGSFL